MHESFSWSHGTLVVNCALLCFIKSAAGSKLVSLLSSTWWSSVNDHLLEMNLPPGPNSEYSPSENNGAILNEGLLLGEGGLI